MKNHKRLAAAALAAAGMIFLYLGISFKSVPLSEHKIEYTVYSSTASCGIENEDIGSDTKIININSASVDELMLLDGIGETKANAIVEYRNANGYFTSVDELLNVSGIGEKTLEKIRDSCTV